GHHLRRLGAVDAAVGRLRARRRAEEGGPHGGVRCPVGAVAAGARRSASHRGAVGAGDHPGLRGLRRAPPVVGERPHLVALRRRDRRRGDRGGGARMAAQSQPRSEAM
ncbi:MAG: hypothetical protein AVDCRST_MAG53-712, partial [uncultured Solirubrobacteraceae bacterium]